MFGTEVFKGISGVLLVASLASASVFVTGCASSPEVEAANMKEQAEMSKTQRVVALLESLETGDPTPVSYINPDKYIQHNLGVADGLEGFGAVLAQLPEGSTKAKVVRVFEDGDFVFAHTEYDFFGPKIGFDIFRFEDGLIVEHWDNLQETVERTPSGHTMIDGPTAVSSPGQTEESRRIVTEFMQKVLVGGDFDSLTTYVSTETYIQHNPGIADGLDGLGQGLAALAEQGIEMKYDRVHKVLAQGEFVLTVSEGAFGGQPTSYYDLFRVEGGKIVEHWDTIEQIPERAAWKNDNGKFGF